MHKPEPFIEKRSQTPETGMKDVFEEVELELSVWKTVYSNRETGLPFQTLFYSRKFSTGTTRKVVTCITGILRKLYGKMVKHLKDAGKRTVGSVCLGGMGF